MDNTNILLKLVLFNFKKSHYSDPKIPNIPIHNELIKIFNQDECEMLNWNSAADTFPKFVQLIQYPEFSYFVILGFVSSVGGMTETLVSLIVFMIFIG